MAKHGNSSYEAQLKVYYRRVRDIVNGEIMSYKGCACDRRSANQIVKTFRRKAVKQAFREVFGDSR